MKLTILSRWLATLLMCVGCANSYTSKDHARDTGLSAKQLRNLANSLPSLPGTIQAVQFLRSDGFSIDRAAILTGGRTSGWHISVFHIESDDKFALEWKSGKLDASFAVSEPDKFLTYDVATSSLEQALTFSGCGAHNCPDVFSVMLYVPSLKKSFTATYILGKVTYSPDSGGPEYQYYKACLDHFIMERRSLD